MYKHPHFGVSMALASLLGTGNGMSQLRGQPKNTRNRNNKDAKRTRAYNRKRR